MKKREWKQYAAYLEGQVDELRIKVEEWEKDAITRAAYIDELRHDLGEC